jgi:prevent-host-death family protein
MPTEIGAFEAKTKFSEILRKVDQGESFTITVRGRVVAQLTPPSPDTPAEEITAAVQALIDFPRIKGIPGDTVLQWIHEGRKY